MKRTVAFLILIFFLVLSHLSFAAPLVTYTASGSSGNWLLDFSVTNTLGVNNLDIYYFGIVNPNSGTAMTSPTVYWGATNNDSVNPSGIGGPDITFNNTWTDAGGISDMIQNGETLSGFTTVFNTVSVPTSIMFNASAYDWVMSGAAVYLGSDYFGLSGNPVFVGTASQVPEPATMLLLGFGLIGLIAYGSKKLL
jgi:hypothetical protein